MTVKIKNKISEFPPKITINDSFSFGVEYFVPVARFRWFAREISGSVVYEEKVLQQLHQGNQGSERWEDVETVFED